MDGAFRHGAVSRSVCHVFGFLFCLLVNLYGPNELGALKCLEHWLIQLSASMFLMPPQMCSAIFIAPSSAALCHFQFTGNDCKRTGSLCSSHLDPPCFASSSRVPARFLPILLFLVSQFCFRIQCLRLCGGMVLNSNGLRVSCLPSKDCQ